jgi:hypothetical protein
LVLAVGPPNRWSVSLPLFAGVWFEALWPVFVGLEGEFDEPHLAPDDSESGKNEEVEKASAIS